MGNNLEIRLSLLSVFMASVIVSLKYSFPEMILLTSGADTVSSGIGWLFLEICFLSVFVFIAFLMVCTMFGEVSKSVMTPENKGRVDE